MKALITGCIHKHHQQTSVVLVCPELLPKHRPSHMTFHYGSASIRTKVAQNKQTNSVSFPQTIWSKLSLPDAHHVHFHIVDDHLYIGPLVGILTTGISAHNSTNPIGSRSSLMAHFLYAQKEIPVSYFVFAPEDISARNQKIRGLFLREHNGRKVWKKATIPFPDVVFDRIPNRKSENTTYAKAAKQLLVKAGTQLFNPGFFNKWTIHEQIYHADSVKQYIPETIFTPKEKELNHLVHKYGSVYLKPANGSLGLGIMKLFHLQDKGYFLQFRQRGTNNLRRYDSLSTLWRHFPLQLDNTTYIAQQGISLIQLKQRPIDFRVHTNKNKHGQWQVSAIAAKIAGAGSVTTHARTGGLILPYEKVLQRCFDAHNQAAIHTKMHHAALQLSRAIDEHLPGEFGEIGFDIGLDRQGHPWMFEANSKPGRHIFFHPNMKKSDQLTRRMILEYALYLANFTKKDVQTDERHSPQKAHI